MGTFHNPIVRVIVLPTSSTRQCGLAHVGIEKAFGRRLSCQRNTQTEAPFIERHSVLETCAALLLAVVFGFGLVKSDCLLFEGAGSHVCTRA